MRALVVFGSKHGDTAALASAIGRDLEAGGVPATVRSAAGGPDPEGFDAVIVVGEVHMRRWHSASRLYVKHHAATLATTPTWLVSTIPGPQHVSESPPQVARLAAAVHARHAALAGAPAPDDLAVGQWAATVASELRARERFTEQNIVGDRDDHWRPRQS